MTKTALPFRLLIATVVAGGLGAVLGAAGTARAADALAYQISPPVQDLAMNPGTSMRGVIKVTNLTDTQMTLQVSKQNFVAKGEEGEVELTDAADPLYSLAPYFSLSQPTVDVAPRVTSQVGFTLTVPAKAEPGGRYGSITFNTTQAQLPSGESGAAVQQRLAALIFLRINGPAHEQLAVAGFGPDKGFYEYGPVNLLVRVQNLGNVHEKPTGQIVVRNMLGLVTTRITLDQKYVIPGAVRRVEATLARHLLLGRYTATLTLHNGTAQTLTAVTSFWVVPYKLLTAVVLGLLLVLVVLWRGRKRFGRAVRILAGQE